MYAEIAKILLSAALFRATNVFGTRTSTSYASLSVLLLAIHPEKKIPEIFLLYTASAFILYLFCGIIYRAARKRPDFVKSSGLRGVPKIASGVFLPIFFIGYMITALGINKYVSFAATWILFLALGKKHPKKSFYAAASAAAIAHSMIFSGGKTIIYPAMYGIAYLAGMHFFSAAKYAFSRTCKPENLKEGMMLAEGIVWDGKKYVFGSDPFPSFAGLFSYNAQNRISSKGALASLFSPLKKENIPKIQKIAKKYNKPVLLVQKKIDFVPFLIIGAAITFFVE